MRMFACLLIALLAFGCRMPDPPKKDGPTLKIYNVGGSTVAAETTELNRVLSEADLNATGQKTPLECALSLFAQIEKGDPEAASILANNPEKQLAQWQAQASPLKEGATITHQLGVGDSALLLIQAGEGPPQGQFLRLREGLWYADSEMDSEDTKFLRDLYEPVSKGTLVIQ